MTRDTFKEHGVPTTGREGDSRTPHHPSRLVPRVMALCLLLYLALALQPSLPIPGRAASAKRAAAIPPAHLNVNEPEPAVAVFFPIAPPSISINSVADSQVLLSWAAVSGAVGYRVERSPNLLTTYSFVGSPTVNSFQDAGVSRGNTYLYRVRAIDSAGAMSPPSAVVMATAITFVDPELIGANDTYGRAATVVKSDHVNDLRAAVASVRRAAQLPSVTWAQTVSSSVPVRADHVRELRQKLDEALAALGLSHPAYTDPTLSTGQNGSTSTPIRKKHFEELRAFSTRGTGVTGSGLGAYDFASARLDPSNRTGGGGVDLLSRNFNWSLPLVSLPGRAGLDLGLSLAYNSLVWTRSGNYILFDGDGGWPAPGFRLGFPVVQGKFYDSQAQKQAYLLVTPSGTRVSLRQTATAGVYEAVNSSYLQLTEEANGSLTLRAIDGTRMSYWPLGGVYKCREIKDRNGNFITVAYNTFDNIETITDTLGRSINFGYYPDGYLKEITQTWQREVENSSPVTETHQWARFYYADKVVRTNFTGLTVFGPATGQTFRALTKVKLTDDSSYTFNYTTWGQVNQVAVYAADNRLLNYVSLDLPADETTAQEDCPRPTQRRDWAAYWHGDEDGAGAAAEEAVAKYGIFNFDSGVAKVEAPDGTVHQETYETSGWKRGLVTKAEEFSADDPQHPKKWTTLSWTQDNEALGYQQNPRLTETIISDLEGNSKRTITSYQNFALPGGSSCFLPVDVAEAKATTILRHVRTSYHLAEAYTSRRIIGLADTVQTFEGETSLLSKLSYTYDEAGYLADQTNPVQHDSTYGPTLISGRGNLTSVRRWDVTRADNASYALSSHIGYNIAGSVVSITDPLNHTSTIGYADSYSGGNIVANTYAYPTVVTDAGGSSLSFTYNYDDGAITKQRDPLGAEMVSQYDSIGRLTRQTTRDGVAGTDVTYTRFEYFPSGTELRTYKQLDIINGTNIEAFSLQRFDGNGRVIGTAQNNPSSVNGYSGQKLSYDVMGRAAAQSNPAEINDPKGMEVSSWNPVGDDAVAGWQWSRQEYDWKGRVTASINVDNTRSLASYDGCGCAGGGTRTITDEVGRKLRGYSDLLGRITKLELLNGDGNVYSTTVHTYNARDQLTFSREYKGVGADDGSCPTGTCQESALTYDGYGRLKTSKKPEQTSPTIYSYNSDDTFSTIQDARGATSTFSYNSRKLVNKIIYGVPTDPATGAPRTDIPQTPTTEFGYDSSGNRKWMTDGLGRADYNYDTLSRLKSETRFISDIGAGTPNVGRSFTLNYDYNLAGQLKSTTDPFNALIAYSYDQSGQLNKVATGSGVANLPTYASNIQYRAWGGIKHLDYGNGRALNVGYNSNLQITSFEVPSIISKTYDYYADGKIRYSRDVLNSNFDRAYTFDHVGRIKGAFSGPAARGEADTRTSPYRESFEYDEMNHLVRQIRRLWSNDLSEKHPPAPSTYVNNRKNAWAYDADGRLIGDSVSSPPESFYDAAGLMVRSTPEKADIQQVFDGNGIRIKSTTRQTQTLPDGSTREVTTVIYYVTSSLTGKVISEIDQQGNRKRSFVYLGNQVLARLNGIPGSETVSWEHADLSGATQRLTSASGASSGGQLELDPLGANAGVRDPYMIPIIQQQGIELSYPYVSDMLSGKCTVDGIPTHCSEVMRGVERGVYGACPQNNCGPRVVDTTIKVNGEIVATETQVTSPFMTYNNGAEGFWINGVGSPDHYFPSVGGNAWVSNKGNILLSPTYSLHLSGREAARGLTAAMSKSFCQGQQCEVPTISYEEWWRIQREIDSIITRNGFRLKIPEQDLKKVAELVNRRLGRRVLPPKGTDEFWKKVYDWDMCAQGFFEDSNLQNLIIDRNAGNKAEEHGNNAALGQIMGNPPGSREEAGSQMWSAYWAYRTAKSASKIDDKYSKLNNADFAWAQAEKKCGPHPGQIIFK